MGVSATEVVMDRKNTPVRLSDEAIRWARIASGHTGESMAAYVSRITVERAMQDEEEFHAAIEEEKKQRAAQGAPPPPAKGGAPPKGKGSR